MWLWDGFLNALRMGWEIWWALVLGFALSALVQARAPRARVEQLLGGRGPRDIGLATIFGAASSSCSYAAVAIARSLFAKGSSLVSAMTVQFASTNLVFELGIVLWLIMGWRFTVAEFVGGLILIVVLWAVLTLVVSRPYEEAIRRHAQAAEPGHVHPTAPNVALNFRGDWQMLWKEIGGGLLIAGYVSTLPQSFFNALFITDAPTPLRLAENVLVGPIVAALSFVCSIGNIPLAAVLWGGGISFSGVIAFIYADLIILPLISAYRKYYGARFAVLLTGVMYGAMVAAALAVDGIFSLLGLVPTSRPIESMTERAVTFNYTAVLNIAATIVFALLIGMTLRRGVKDPVCGMTTDRTGPSSVHAGKTYWFCGAHCKHRFDADPEQFVK